MYFCVPIVLEIFVYLFKYSNVSIASLKISRVDKRLSTPITQLLDSIAVSFEEFVAHRFIISAMDDYKKPVQVHFNPYDFNAGTILAIAGDDYSVIATDTRLSQGFSIHSREYPKTYNLTNGSVLGSCGFNGDVLTLTKVIEARLQVFQQDHGKPMSNSSVASMLSTILYYRRFFPYYTQNIVAGIDDEGKGAVFSFDPVGSYEREQYRAKGSASAMLQSLLDNQIGCKNQEGVEKASMPLKKCVNLVKDVFTAAAERDIYTGDSVIINIITKDNDGKTVTKQETFPLRRD